MAKKKPGRPEVTIDDLCDDVSEVASRWLKEAVALGRKHEIAWHLLVFRRVATELMSRVERLLVEQGE